MGGWVPGDAEGPAKSDDQRTNRHAAFRQKRRGRIAVAIVDM